MGQPDVVLCFQSGQIVLRAISGQLVHVWGPSGAGKSTLLSQIWGSRGLADGQLTVRVGGQRLDLRALAPAHLAWVRPKLMAYLPQNPHVPPSARIGGWFAAIDTAHLDEGLAALDLPPSLLTHSASELSGGELRRFCVLRVMFSDAPILLLDEPCSGLDPSRQARVQKLLRKASNAQRLVISTGHAQTPLLDQSIQLG